MTVGTMTMNSKRERRGMTTVDLTDEAKGALDALCERTGLPKKLAVSRVLEWFCDQTEILQALILGQIPESVQGPAAEIALATIRDRAPSEASGSLAEKTDAALRRAKRDRGHGA